MNKAEFISYIAEKNNSTKVEAERIINSFTDAVTSALGEGQEIALLGFGRFYASKVEAREGRNPRTGASMKIDAHTQPKFSAGENLKKACNS
jgi:DNA-binding protein HU-beta